MSYRLKDSIGGALLIIGFWAAAAFILAVILDIVGHVGGQ